MRTVKCIHHWIIEEPNGSTSKGVCNLCGIEREFRNSLDVVINPRLFCMTKTRKNVLGGIVPVKQECGVYKFDW